MTHDNRDPSARRDFFHAIECVKDEWLPTDFVQNLGKSGFHALALACCQNNDSQRNVI